MESRNMIARVWFGVLRFFKLVNHKDELSLTNIAFWIFLYKIAIADMATMSANELATALSVVGLYFGTKILNRNAEKDTKLSTAMKAVETIAEKLNTKAPESEEDGEDGEC